MEGMSRFLSRRGKRSAGEKRKSANSIEEPPPPIPSDLYNIFYTDDNKRQESEEEKKKVKAVAQRLTAYGINTLKDPQITYALRSRITKGDIKEATELLVLFEDSVDGILREYSPKTKLLGAENRCAVTCYLDSLLFAMFARLDSFEAMLFDSFADTPRRRLATILRLWVNLLRAGKLITVDITKHLQEALAQCGWEDAAQLNQQDASEAFTFITGQLELPLLTLKMDIYHTGKEDVADDHRFVNERLLEVAIPEDNPHSDEPIKLEECLEIYFNNRIEVRRHLERRSTLQKKGPYSETSSLFCSPCIAFDENSLTSRAATGPPTPADETRTSFLSSRRGSKATKKSSGGSKSRPTSQSGEGRLSITMSRLTGRKSRDKLSDSTNTLPLRSSDTKEKDENSGGDDSNVEGDPSNPLVLVEAPTNNNHAPQKSSTSMGFGRTKKEKKARRSSSVPLADELARAEGGGGKGKAKKKPPDRECVVM
ncbi:putative ubiquitin c-terminal hydrolase family protein [Diplodia seriata]|uniref:Putative ubiquitin c-terminal hydrolase family protein n=1 Tax=Diplodia seriata TaxID=420778 RepID=A0A0G2GA48_9PEZI|nr:putative ubiquitin c-terminal hydrolase family protein [Diplodia seriata]